jgi:hypothetical protein
MLTLQSIALLMLMTEMTNSLSNFYAYERDEFQKFLGKINYSVDYLSEVGRNSSGTNLYFYQSPAKGSNVLIVSSKKEIKILLRPADNAYLNDKGEFVAWFNDIKNGIHFKNGKIRYVVEFGNFGVDPSGQYFFIESTLGETEIAIVDNPEKPIARSELRGQKIFYNNGILYLFGFQSSNPNQIICHVFRNERDGYIMEREVVIPSSHHVVDMDPASGNVLVMGLRHMFPSWYIFNLKSLKMTNVGLAKTYGFFLREDILKAIDTRSN